MGVLPEGTVFSVVAVAAALIAITVTYFKWKFTYWEKIGLRSLKPSIPFGNLKDQFMGKLTFGEQFRNFYEQFKTEGSKHGGVYFAWRPFYVPIDPKIIKHIMQVDFQHFVNHGVYINEENDPLSGHLFNLEDAKWKQMRTKLTPTFTSGKMKMMFQTLADCTVGLKDIMDESASTRSPVDIKDVLGRFTMDIIGSAAFGLECNSLKTPDGEFRKYGKRVFDITSWERIKTMMQFFIPRSVLDLVKFKLTNNDVERFFMKVVRDTVNYREKNEISRKDFMHLLLQLKNRGKVTDDDKITSDFGGNQGLNMNELTAQAFVFFLAGFETSSTTMTFALYELATNPDIQQKLREEIREVLAKHDNKLSYDAIMEMTYMDKVLNETLRKYPPVPVLFRQCTKDYVVPDTSIKIEKGVDVAISSLGLQNDPEYYPNPEKFDPERFSEENKSKRPAFTWIPFGEGPRICIGLRFGMMQSKVGLTTLLRNYNITLNRKTVVPLVFEKSSLITTVEGGVWLDVKSLDK